jgi:hypothetical protein
VYSTAPLRPERQPGRGSDDHVVDAVEVDVTCVRQRRSVAVARRRAGPHIERLQRRSREHRDLAGRRVVAGRADRDVGVHVAVDVSDEGDRPAELLAGIDAAERHDFLLCRGERTGGEQRDRASEHVQALHAEISRLEMREGRASARL